MSMEQAKFQGFVLEKLTISQSGVAYIMINQEDLQRCGITEEESNIAVGIPGSIEGVKTWALFIKQEGNHPYWRVRLRSKGPIINELATRYHGGGHPKASGASIYSDEELNNFLAELNKISEAYTEESI